MRRTLARLIRWMLGIQVLLCTLAMAQTPVPIPITGNLGSISGQPQPYAGILVQLWNCPSPASVTGYFGIVQTAYQLQANASGQINSTIWPNDLLTCNGTTGASMYNEVPIVDGVPSGTPQCYQVTSTQGIWNLNTQQPIPCIGTPPNPQDATYENLIVLNFFQANNALFTGSVTIDGTLTLGTAPGTCPTGQFINALSTTLTETCAAPSISGVVTSITDSAAAVGAITFAGAGVSQSGNTFTFSGAGTPFYQTINSNGTAQTQRSALNFSPRFALSDSSGPSETTADLAASGITAAPYTCPNVTFDVYGRATTATSQTCVPSFTGTSGYQTMSGGLIFEWGLISNFDTGPVSPSFPLTFPHACFGVNPYQYQDSGTEFQGVLLVPTSGVQCTTTQFTVRNNGATSVGWFAWGW